MNRLVALAKKYRTRAKLFSESGAYAQRGYIVIEEKKLIYQLMYKVACSSIMASLTGMGKKENYLRIHHILGGKGEIIRNLPYDAHPGFFRFTFVRDPLERLVSCYVSKYRADQAILGKHYLPRLYFDRYLFGFLKKDKGFAQFARRVSRIPDCLSDRHFVSQHFMIHDKKGRKTVEFVGRFENLSDEFAPIAQKYDLAALPTYNATQKGAWMDYYDLKTARRVIKRYQADIEAFGYEDSAKALMAHLESREAARQAQ
ncbi:MAG: sulfotransferase family 2 domain-containing protein [Clostridia bacterium]